MPAPSPPHEAPDDDSPTTKDEIEAENLTVERRLTAEEIFVEGFKRGQETAGLRSNPQLAYEDFLIARIEGRS